MRAFSAIGAALALGWLIPATGHAETQPSAAAVNTQLRQPAAASCDEPGPGYRPHRPVHRVVRHVRHRRPRRLAAVPALPYPPPIYYNTGIPSPYDTAYDRAMTLHFRSPFVTGLVDPEPGYPHTPPVLGVQPYRFRSGPAVYQYDGSIGEYVVLSAYDAARALPPAPPPPPPAPPPPGR